MICIFLLRLMPEFAAFVAFGLIPLSALSSLLLLPTGKEDRGICAGAGYV